MIGVSVLRRPPTVRAAGTRTGRVELAVRVVVVVAIIVLTLYPLVLLLSTALQPPGTGASVSLFSHLSFASFANAWSQGHFSTYMLNTVIMTVGVVVPAALFSLLAAYGIAQLKPAGSRLLLMVAILGFMLPTEALLIPWYYQLRGYGLLNTYLALILPQAAQGVAFGVFWMTVAFRALPQGLMEAAVLDGASQWQALWKVAVPNLAPAIRTMCALTFLWTWNSFLLPLVTISNPSRYVVTVGLSTFAGARFNALGPLAAGSIIAAIPVVVVYLFSQRSFIAGMLAGSFVE